MKPVPFTQRRRRLPEAGRIRLGVRTTTRNGKTRPTSIDRFRFTSQSEQEIRAIADLYGGDVKPWSDPKAPPSQFEVITDATELNIVLPPDPLGDGPTYEKWGGKGRERSCDGITMETMQDGPDGLEPVESECRCARLGRLECKPKLRLNVILPELRFTGTWRLETSSDFACDEMPEMVEVLQTQQERGLICGLLRLERRQTQGGRNVFGVPTIGISESLDGLMSGRARLGASGSLGAPADVPALGTGGSSTEGAGVAPPLPPGPVSDDDVIDGVVVRSLDEALAELDEPAVEAVKLWWKENRLPKRESLTPAQEQAVLDHIEEMGL